MDVDLNEEPIQVDDKFLTIITKETFFNTFLQLPSGKVEEIRRFLEGKGHYTNNRWSYFPLAGDNRLANHVPILYRSFTALGNAIHKYAKTQRWAESDRIEGKWVAYQFDYEAKYGRPPPSVWSTTPPCCSFIPDDITEKYLDEWLNEVVDPKSRISTESKNSRWGSLVTTVDIRTENTPAIWERSIQRLYDAAHRMLCNQQYRRFVIGLILCANVFKVYVIDRGGIIGFSDMIDIHQDPNSFIQALVAFSVLNRLKLGLGKNTGKKKADIFKDPYENFALDIYQNPNPPYCNYPPPTAKIVRNRPFSHFKDLKELLGGMMNVVKAHKQAYEQGVLHSNITPDSIIFQDAISPPFQVLPSKPKP